MTHSEQAAYNACIEAAINAAQITALTIATGKDAGSFRKRLAAEALAAFAESARGLMLAAPSWKAIVFTLFKTTRRLMRARDRAGR